MSSGGNATGANQASINNAAYGIVGNMSGSSKGRLSIRGSDLNATGNVLSQGQESSSNSEIGAAVRGDQQEVNSFQQGTATGTGDTQAQAIGGAQLTVNGQQSPTSRLF